MNPTALQTRRVQKKAHVDDSDIGQIIKSDLFSTFNDNLSIPVHRWFRFSAGFSSDWAREVMLKEKCMNILDPFAGSGTVMLEAQVLGLHGIGIEAHPFIARIAGAKLHWRESPDEFLTLTQSILAKAKKLHGGTEHYPKLIQACFPKENLQHLDSLRRAWLQHDNKSPLSELAWLTLASILRQCSPVGTAQWQYVLPKKTKARKADPFFAFETKANLMANDMKMLQSHCALAGSADLIRGDARDCEAVPDKSIDLVITSPPYANNYDYADATRLEMSFFGEVQGWGDLQETVRKYLIRSCTQHVTPQIEETMEILKDSILSPIYAEIKDVCEQLGKERELHGGKKAYHTMIACYFLDLADTWVALRRVMKPGARACFVIGDSAPYGVYVPVDEWLGKLAVSAGFKSFTFEKTRDRNIKWKNRKHRVPLKEGRLWVQG